MKINSRTVLLSLVFLVFILIVFFKRNSPFGFVFWLGFHGFIISLIGLIILLTVFLYKKDKIFTKGLSFITGIIGVGFLGVYFLALVDYRIVLPITSFNNLSNKEYKEDLEFFKNIINKHPGYTSQIDSVANLRYEFLEQNIGNISRDDFLKELMGVVGFFKDGHSTIPPMQVFNKAEFLPLVGHYFSDGFYILNASDEYNELKNKKLIRVNNIRIEKIFQKVNQLSGPENNWNAKYRASLYLFSVNTLSALNIIQPDEKVKVSYLQTDGTIVQQTISPEPFINWAFWAFKPSDNRLPTSINIRKPKYFIKHENAEVEIVLNLIDNISESNTLKTLSQELNEILKNQKIDKLIIDLRNNTGGNNFLYKPLIEVIKKHSYINSKQHLFVFTSRTTFSAGINFVDDLIFQTNSTMIGEPPGAGVTHYGDANFHKLPNTGIYFFLSTKKWKGKSTDIESKIISPDILIEYHFQDYLNGADPWVKVLELNFSKDPY